MDAAWYQYRKVTFLGARCFRGGAEIRELRDQIVDSISQLSAWAPEGNDTLAALRVWLENVHSCERNEISEPEICHWILYQPMSMPGPEVHYIDA
jgi:hypothetical protein